MPVYPFRCPVCGLYVEDVRPVSEASKSMMCRDCAQPMNRVFTVPQVSVPNESGYFNHGLGIAVHHKSDVRDELNRIKDNTGRELVEVGNDYKSNQRNLVRREYEIPRGVLDG